MTNEFRRPQQVKPSEGYDIPTHCSDCHNAIAVLQVEVTDKTGAARTVAPTQAGKVQEGKWVPHAGVGFIRWRAGCVFHFNVMTYEAGRGVYAAVAPHGVWHPDDLRKLKELP